MMDEKDKSLRYLTKAVDFGILWGRQDILDLNIVYKNLWEEYQFEDVVNHAKIEKSALRTQVLALEGKRDL